jgi:hypothetical protein
MTDDIIITAQEVHAVNRNSIPDINITIFDDMDLPLDLIKSVNYYLRPAEVCPFGRGNWILDILFLNGTIYCVKLPIEMTEEHFMFYINPVLEYIKDKMH